MLLILFLLVKETLCAQAQHGFPAPSRNYMSRPEHAHALAAGLLYQEAPTPVKLISHTAILRQDVDFQLLARKMEALNNFQKQISEKFLNMANITKKIVMGTRHGNYKPYEVQQLHQAETMLNTSYAAIVQMHDNTRLQQQNIIQKIVQAQQYQQNWQDYQLLTGSKRDKKRSVFSFLSVSYTHLTLPTIYSV